MPPAKGRAAGVASVSKVYCVIGQALGAFEIAVRGEAAGMHEALRDVLVIEAEELLVEDEILQQHRARVSGL